MRKTTRVAECARRSPTRALPSLNVVGGLQPRNFGECRTVGNSENSPISRRCQEKKNCRQRKIFHASMKQIVVFINFNLTGCQKNLAWEKATTGQIVSFLEGVRISPSLSSKPKGGPNLLRCVFRQERV